MCKVDSNRASTKRVSSFHRKEDDYVNMSMPTQEITRIGTAHETVTPSIKEHIAYLEQEIEKVKRQITEQINNDPNLRNKRDLIDSMQSCDYQILPAFEREWKEWQGHRMCYHEKARFNALKVLLRVTFP